MGRDNLFMIPLKHHSSYLNIYPLKSKMEFGMSSIKGEEPGSQCVKGGGFVKLFFHEN